MIPDTTWMTSALCRGCPNVMFPDPDAPEDELQAMIERARNVCAACSVYDDCLQWALSVPTKLSDCVTAGLTEKELELARRELADWRRSNHRARCGTATAYVAHLARGETCEWCRDRHNRRSCDAQTA